MYHLIGEIDVPTGVNLFELWHLQARLYRVQGAIDAAVHAFQQILAGLERLGKYGEHAGVQGELNALLQAQKPRPRLYAGAGHLNN